MKDFKKNFKKKWKLLFKALRKYVNNNDLEHKCQQQEEEIEVLSRERDFWKLNYSKANEKLLRKDRKENEGRK